VNKKVIILGGSGRIGREVAKDLARHTQASITITGRSSKPDGFGEEVSFWQLDLDDYERLRVAIKNHDLVIHCAGPFHYRDGRVLQICIEEKVNYIDVSDHRSFYQKVIPWREQAQEAGITAILNTGVFPGISNSMVKQGIEQLDEAETINLSYVVAGSGGAGVTVMRTTFLGLRTPFQVWQDGKWQQQLPYTEREVKQFPAPYGKVGVYWFDMPETYTFAESFQVKNIITKFGSVPDFYNYLTWITAHIFPQAWVTSTKGIEFFSRVSYAMTQITDRLSGVGVAMRAEIFGKKDNLSQVYLTTTVHSHAAVATGLGAGSVAQLVLEERLTQAGIYPVEQILPTDLFLEVMAKRGVLFSTRLTMAN
jgi:saccharopine dehydrogenase-like NADP-dependent oxidoreductase